VSGSRRAAKIAAGVALAFASIPCASPAAADDAPAARAAMGDDMRGYYAGERNSAYVVGGLGVAALGGGGALVTRDGDFARGMGWALVSIGAIDVVGAIFYTFQVSSQVDRYESLLAHDPGEYKRVEYDHISGTTSRFVGYKLGELGLVLTGAGIATYGFSSNRDAWKGAGIGVAAMALPVLVIDTINGARAARYRDSVHDFRPTIAIEPGVSGQPWSFAVGGRF
jgi:hypothetical protein